VRCSYLIGSYRFGKSSCGGKTFPGQLAKTSPSSLSDEEACMVTDIGLGMPIRGNTTTRHLLPGWYHMNEPRMPGVAGGISQAGTPPPEDLP
jgi:hypothetical protein